MNYSDNMTAQVEELKSAKYRKALKIIQDALNNWAYDTLRRLSRMGKRRASASFIQGAGQGRHIRTH